MLWRMAPPAGKAPCGRFGALLWTELARCGAAGDRGGVTDPLDILHTTFGFPDFRGVQRQVVDRVLAGERTRWR